MNLLFGLQWRAKLLLFALKIILGRGLIYARYFVFTRTLTRYWRYVSDFGGAFHKEETTKNA